MSKEVKINSVKEVKKTDFYFRVFSLLKAGKTIPEICEILKISKQAISYYLKNLKASNSIKKVGYGVWETLEFKPKEVKKDGLGRSIRGHGFCFTIRLPKIDRWEEREQYLKNQKIPFSKLNNNVHKIYFRQHKIWLCNNTVVIYYPSGKSYFSDSAENSNSLAIYDLQQLIIGLENLFKVSFKINKNYEFKVSRQHYGKIKDQLAKQCNKEGKKIFIRLEKGYFVIDNSFNLNEAETQGEGAISYMDDNYTPFIRSLMDVPFTTYDFKKLYNVSEQILTIQKGETEKWGFYAENIKSHTEAIIKLNKGINRLVGIKERNIKKHENQKKLGEF